MSIEGKRAGVARGAAARTRLATVGLAGVVLAGLLIGGPVTGGVAEEPKPVTPAVQEIKLGTPEAPADAVDVVPADQSPSPSAPVESSPNTTASSSDSPPSATDSGATPTASPSAAPSSSATRSAPTPSGASSAPANEAGTNPAPAPSDELAPSAAMPVPEGAQTLVLDQTQTNGFSSVGISWLGDAPVNGIALQVRVKDAVAGKWSEWTDLSVNREVAPDATAGIRQGSDPYWFGSSIGVEVAVTVMPGTELSDLKLTLIDPKKVTQDANAEQSAPTSSAGAAVPRPDIYSRAQWGADESKMKWTPQYSSTIKAATLHHSADGNNYAAADVPGLMRSIYQYQAVTLGWGDIGYNVVVDKFGRAWEGRAGGLDKPVIGAHAGGFNRDTFGVSMLGNYELVPVPDATRETVARLIAWKLGMYGFNPGAWTSLTQYGGAGTTAKYTDGTTVSVPTVFGHRDVGNTVCPGKYGYPTLDWLRNRAAELIKTYNMPAYDPQGAFAAKPASPGQVAVDGWAFDKSELTSPINVMITVDGTPASIVAANGPRPELANYGVPGNHGFATKLGATPGSRSICMFAFNIGAGNNVLVGCTTVIVAAVTDENPRGAIAASANEGVVTYDGWAYDPSSPANGITVMIQSNGTDRAFIGATGPRPELASFGIPGNHGFSGSFYEPTAGTTNVCVFAFNIGAGTSKVVDCKSVKVTHDNPRGAMGLRRSGGTVVVDGWAYDPNSLVSPVNVMLTVNGNAAALLAASGSRPELASYGIPGNHGFVSSVSAPPGASVCLFVFNIGPGSNTLAQCGVV